MRDSCTPDEEEMAERREREVQFCCGQPLAYCECPALVRARAYRHAVNAQAWAELPRSADDSEPPF